jgi:hypothetical protein
MNRVMMEVFPTDWSPRNTSLYFARGASDVDPVMGRFEDAEAFGADVDVDAVAAGDGAEVFVSLILTSQFSLFAD